jgi:TonB family protein
MFFKSLTQTVTRAALLCALSLSFAPLASTDASAFCASAQSHDANASADADAFERGKRLLREGDAQLAAMELRRVAENRKSDADAWYLFGVALSRAGDGKGARKAFEKSLKLRPSDADAHTGLAYTLLTLGKLRDAEREARRALALNPQVAEAHYVVGVVRYREDKFKEAEDEAREALRVKPTLGAAAYLAGDSLMALFFDESDRQAELHPTTPYAGDTARREAIAARAPALEPIKARMLDVAASLEKIADAQSSNPEAALWREQAGSMRFYGGEGEDFGVFRPSEVIERAVIYSKPVPGFTEEARVKNTSGMVKLRAVLAADGRVRNIAVVRSLPDGLTERCISVARQIKFKPAQKDGHAVSQYVTLEYNFYIH